MVKIPVKFKRVAAAFNEVARARSCESTGSEHSADLSDLVNSFLEREIRDYRESKEINGEIIDDGNEIKDYETESNCPDFEFEDSLKNLLFDGENDAGVKRRIRSEVEKACRELNGSKSSSSDFNRRLMARLRSGGLNAGLCKSKWEKNGRCPSGDYKYIDVNTGGTRYIIEVFLAGEFTIARPTNFYTSLLEVFPPIFVGKSDELKQLVTLMCNAIRKSMKSVGIDVPPWRRLAYLQAKWFGSYKRTVNEISGQKAASFGGDFAGNRSVGFVPVPKIWYYCRDDFATKAAGEGTGNAGARTGNLAAALN